MSSRGRCRAGDSRQVVGRAQDRWLRWGLPLPTSSRRSILTLGGSSPHQGLPLLSSFELSLGPSPLHFIGGNEAIKCPLPIGQMHPGPAPAPEAPPPESPPTVLDQQVSTSRLHSLSCLHSPLGGGCDTRGRCLCPGRTLPGLAHLCSPACL